MSMAEVAEAITRDHNTLEMTEGRILRLITRGYMPLLTNPELRVLLFVFDRTWMYGKPTERIPMKHFTDGVWSGDECIHPGVNMTRANVYKAIAKLVDNVILLRQQDGGSDSPSYSINPLGPSQVSRKRDSTVSKARQGVSPTGDYEIEEYNERNTNSVAHTREAVEESVNMDAMDAVRAAVAGATAKTKAQQTKKQAKGNASAYESIWQSAYISTYSEERWFPWTIAIKAAFKKALDRGVPSEYRTAFITFTVSRWLDVISGQFAWMKNPPQLPAVQFVTKNVQAFWQAFEDDRDPNRRVKRRIANSGARQVAPVQPAPDNSELETLRKRNAELEAVVKANDQEKVIRRRLTIKRVVKPRAAIAKGDGEFIWRDND